MKHISCDMEFCSYPECVCGMNTPLRLPNLPLVDVVEEPTRWTLHYMGRYFPSHWRAMQEVEEPALETFHYRRGCAQPIRGPYPYGRSV